MSLGIYIHLPYCLTKCPYCDFNSYGVGEDFPEDEYTISILGEIELYSTYLSGCEVDTVFFGGGTPSLFKPKNIKRILDRIADITDLKKGAEISLEINPRTADRYKLAEFQMSGVNRASIGIQSFSERKLKFYGRLNSPEDALCALGDIRDAGFKNFNIDLIYGSTDETLEEFQDDINTALSMNPNHLSLYCLTIEDGTLFGKLYKKGMLKLPSDQQLSEMYDLSHKTLENYGYEHYEISNFSIPGSECRHNLIYWHCGDYLGFGAGAHSHMKQREFGPWGKRWGNIKNPSAYMKQVSDGCAPYDFTEELTRYDSLTDKLLMGLRLKEGVDYQALKSYYSASFKKEEVSHLVDDGLIDISRGQLMITDSGRIYSDRLIGLVSDSFVLR